MQIQTLTSSHNLQSIHNKPFLGKNSSLSDIKLQTQASTMQQEKQTKNKNNILNDMIFIPIGTVFGGAIGKLIQIQKEKNIEKQSNRLWNDLINFSDIPRIKNFYNNYNIAGSYTELLFQTLKISYASEGGFELPNCILFEGKNEIARKNTMNYFKVLSRANHAEMDIYKDDLLDTLDVLKEKYTKTNKWNVLHVKNMDDYINPNKVHRSIIESMKAIMCCTAEEFHTTITFETKNSKMLDDIALESNRITGHYYTDKMKHLDEYMSMYSKFLDMDNKKAILKKKNLLAKGAGIGAAVGVGIILTHIFVNKYIKSKGEKNENK